MWVAFAFASALFAGLTAILAKVGVRHTDSNLATAIRTTVVLAAAWLMVLLVGSASQLGTLSGSTIGFLVASGLATGGSWLCYFKALQLGDLNKVAPIDRLSIVLTVVLAMIFLGEADHLATRLPGIAVIGIGTWLMVRRPATEVPATPAPPTARGGWFLYALGAAVFASLTALLGKVGISGVESNLGTAIRTSVVLVLAWGIVIATGGRPLARRFRGATSRSSCCRASPPGLPGCATSRRCRTAQPASSCRSTSSASSSPCCWPGGCSANGSAGGAGQGWR